MPPPLHPPSCPPVTYPPAPTRTSSPSISSFFFNVSDNIESLRRAPCDFTSTSTPPTDKFPLPLCPLSPTNRSQSCSLSPTIPTTPPPHCHDSRREGQCIVRGTSQRFRAPAAATSWTRTPTRDVSGNTPLRLAPQKAERQPTMIKRAPIPTTTLDLCDGRIYSPWISRHPREENPHPPALLQNPVHGRDYANIQ